MMKKLIALPLLLSLLAFQASAGDAGKPPESPAKTDQPVRPPPSVSPAAPATAQGVRPVLIQGQDILDYLSRAVAWQRAIAGLELAPDNARQALLKDALRVGARKTLQTSFAFARAQAPQADDVAEHEPTEGESRHARLIKLNADAGEQVTRLRSQLKSLPKELARAHRSARPTLLARREKLTGQLKLAEAQHELLSTMVDIFSKTDSAQDGGLLAKVDSLSRSVLDESEAGPQPPGGNGKTDAATAAASRLIGVPLPASPAADAPSQGDGLFDLIGGVFTLSRKSEQIDDLLDETAAYKAANQDLIMALRAGLKDAIKQGQALADKDIGHDAKAVAAHRQTLDALIGRYRQMAASMIPLGQVSASLDGAARRLTEWKTLLTQEVNSAFRHFLWRLAVLGLSLLIPFFLSEMARRATLRYVSDPKRQRQLRILRRIVFGTVLLLVVLLNFVSEFGSLATFAGFLTAGLAVALQTVLVSAIAHFFFFGRFGVRAGDRVTIGGVTGDVVQIGMLRIYLMEQVGDPGNLRPSGKIVAFPNSVLFSPSAFSKQISGTSYEWSDLVFVLEPGVDYAAANERIMTAVGTVYADYQEAMARQRSALEESTRLSVKVPSPRSELRLVESGLACVVHLPILLSRAGEIKERVTRALIEVFAQEEGMILHLSNPIRISPAEPAR